MTTRTHTEGIDCRILQMLHKLIIRRRQRQFTASVLGVIDQALGMLDPYTHGKRLGFHGNGMIMEHLKSIPGTVSNGKNRMITIDHRTILKAYASKSPILANKVRNLGIKTHLTAQRNNSLAQILHNLRDADYSDRFEKYFELSSTLSTRDKDGIKKTFSGLMKLIYPDGKATPEQMEPLLRCAIEGRKRVKDQLCRIDSTMEEVEFTYKRVSDGEVVAVQTLEELDYPQLYWRGRVAENSEDESEAESFAAGDDVAIAGSEDKAGASENADALPVARHVETVCLLTHS